MATMKTILGKYDLGREVSENQIRQRIKDLKKKSSA
jgi:hypothetical protein